MSDHFGCGDFSTLYGRYEGLQIRPTSLLVFLSRTKKVACLRTVFFVIVVGSICLLKMDSVSETLFDGTEAHGFLEIAKPLEMVRPGIGSDFFSNDAIFALTCYKLFNCFVFYFRVIVERETEASYSTVCHRWNVEPCRARA